MADTIYNEYGSWTDETLKAMWADDPSSRRISSITGIPESTIRSRSRRWLQEEQLESELDPDRQAKVDQILASIPREKGDATAERADVALYGNAAYDTEKREWVKVGLNSVRVRYDLKKKKSKAEWPVIGPHYHVEVKTYEPLPRVQSDFERVYIWGDTQIGWWRDGSSLTPFHDEAAIDAGLQMLALYRPDRLVIIGDFLDFPELGKYRKEPAFAFTLNPAIAYATELLAKMRAIVGPECEIDFIPGNHEARLTSAIVDNLAALYGIRRPADAFPLLSIPFLLQFEKFNIRCAEQYPAGQVWLTDDIVCTHAPDKRLRATQICGHLVKQTTDSETFHYRYDAKTYKTIIVPGFGNYGGKPADKFRLNRTNIPSNVARSNAEQACATVEITRDHQHYKITPWEIVNGFVIFKDREIQGIGRPWNYTEAA